MESQNVRTARAQVDAFNRRDLEAQVEAYADRFTMTDHARSTTLRSRHEVTAWMAEWLASSSDNRVKIERVIDAGDSVVSVLAFEGTNDGPMGPIPPTGRRFTVRGVQILAFDAQGRIVQHDNFFDQLSIMVQLGLAPAPGKA